MDIFTGEYKDRNQALQSMRSWKRNYPHRLYYLSKINGAYWMFYRLTFIWKVL